jgi:hypothetical protein
MLTSSFLLLFNSRGAASGMLGLQLLRQGRDRYPTARATQGPEGDSSAIKGGQARYGQCVSIPTLVLAIQSFSSLG